jgi:hypothetical protein
VQTITLTAVNTVVLFLSLQQKCDQEVRVDGSDDEDELRVLIRLGIEQLHLRLYSYFVRRPDQFKRFQFHTSVSVVDSLSDDSEVKLWLR